MDAQSPLDTRLMAPSRAALKEAGRLLHDGQLVAFPTETVYGLGGDAGSDRAVAAIFAAKARPHINPLIVHVADRDAAEPLVHFNAAAEKLAQAYWPGPLTLVLPRRAGARLSPGVSAGLDSIAIRVPGHPVARSLLKATRLPLAAPSANRSGKVSPTTPQHVMAELAGRIPMILAGGRTHVGLESTVVDLTGDRPVLLRPGAVTRAQIEDLVGPVAAAPSAANQDETAGLKAPGQLLSHYAPNAALRLNAATPEPGEAFLAFGPAIGTGAPDTINLSEAGDLEEAAANLFAALRDLDGRQATTIAVAPIPEQGLGEAINDRLRRAAAPRPLAKHETNA